MNIQGVFLHILGDALGSVVVIVSALLIKYFDSDWVLRVDPALRSMLSYTDDKIFTTYY